MSSSFGDNFRIAVRLWNEPNWARQFRLPFDNR
jgi:hypothetical protein